MNSIQLALIVGAFTASGLAIIVLRLIRADPDLRSFLADLSPTDTPPDTPTSSGGVTGSDRVGLWITRTLHTSWLNPPAADLAILRKPLYQFWGERVTFALAGLLLPLALSALAAVVSAFTGFSIPLYVPIVATIACAVGFSFIPDYNVRSDAATARFTFRQTLAVYVDLVSMQRRTNAQPRQAMEVAAAAADAWALQRIREVLLRSTVTGDFPWTPWPISAPKSPSPNSSRSPTSCAWPETTTQPCSANSAPAPRRFATGSATKNSPEPTPPASGSPSPSPCSAPSSSCCRAPPSSSDYSPASK